jgi:thiol-disulfide isomerase/thioredoxin
LGFDVMPPLAIKSNLMRALVFCACLAMFLTCQLPADAQNSPPAQADSSPSTSATPITPAPSPQNANAEAELQKAVTSAGNDRAALVRNLQDYLRRFPDGPQKESIYRALVKTCQEIRDNDCLLEYGERLIAITPDDLQTLMVTVNALQQKGDDASLARAITYVTRVIDQTSNTYSYQRPERLSVAEWQDRRAQLLLGLYLVRGDIQKTLRHYDAATQDYYFSFTNAANPAAAEGLGDIAELHNDANTAIQEFLLAFVLPDAGPRKVDRRVIRRKLGNVWQQVHGSQQGLGEEILAAFDRNAQPVAPAGSGVNAHNKEARDLFDFVLRRLDGSPVPLAPLKGKIIVLSFWATWCAPCRELEPQLAQIAKHYAENSGIVFLAVNMDEEESLVPAYAAREKWDLPLVYADGLNKFLGVTALPTVLILDRNGKVVYNASGFPEKGFTESIENSLRLAGSSAKQ